MKLFNPQSSGRRWHGPTLAPRIIFLHLVINTSASLCLTRCMQIERGVLGLIRKGQGLAVLRGQSKADNAGLVQNSAWELSYLALAGAAVGFLWETRSKLCFPLVVRLPPPSRLFPAPWLSLYLQTWHNLLPQELDVFLRLRQVPPPGRPTPTSVSFQVAEWKQVLNDILFLWFSDKEGKNNSP